MRRLAADEPADGGEDAFRLRLRVGHEDLLFEPLRHCRNSNERARMLLTYALQGYLASLGITLGQQLQAIVHSGGLVATMTDLRALAGKLDESPVQGRAAPAFKSEVAGDAVTPPAAVMCAPAPAPAENPAPRFQVSGLDVLALGDAVHI